MIAILLANVSIAVSVGLFAGFWMALLTSIFGGRPGMVSGATGSMASVMPSYVEKYCINLNPLNKMCEIHDRGAQFIFLAVIFAGIFQMICGIVRLPELLRLLPHTALAGFRNGLAIIIAEAQLHFFYENGLNHCALFCIFYLELSC